MAASKSQTNVALKVPNNAKSEPSYGLRKKDMTEISKLYRYHTSAAARHEATWLASSQVANQARSAGGFAPDHELSASLALVAGHRSAIEAGRLAAEMQRRVAADLYAELRQLEKEQKRQRQALDRAHRRDRYNLERRLKAAIG